MLQAAAAGSASNTDLTQPASGRASRPPAGPRKTGRSPKGPRVTGEERESVRQADRPVIEMEHGITVYPPEAAGEPWRAVFVENGTRRFRQGANLAAAVLVPELRSRQRRSLGSLECLATGAKGRLQARIPCHQAHGNAARNSRLRLLRARLEAQSQQRGVPR